MTLLEIMILGIIAEEPAHAYNIEKVIEDRGVRKTLKIGFSTIYSTLKKMEKNQYLESSFISQEKLPGRRIYAITHKGKQHLVEALKKSLSQPRKEATHFDIGLSFAGTMTIAEIKSSLSLYEAELARLIQEKVRELTNLDTKDPLKRAMINRPLAMWQAERKWVKELIQFL